MTEHTPEPWTVKHDRGNRRIRVVARDGIIGVATIHALLSQQANASLIAAAPDLLAACKKAEEWLDSWASAEPYIDTIRAAIEKAEPK